MFRETRRNINRRRVRSLLTVLGISSGTISLETQERIGSMPDVEEANTLRSRRAWQKG